MKPYSAAVCDSLNYDTKPHYYYYVLDDAQNVP